MIYELNKDNRDDNVSILKIVENVMFCKYFLRYFEECHWNLELSPVCQICILSRILNKENKIDCKDYI